MAGLMRELKYQFAKADITLRFIYINVAVFVLIHVISVGGFLFNVQGMKREVLQWIAGSSNPDHMLRRPWTVLTYMFVHEGLFHILFNMLLLYFAGRYFADLYNSKRFIAVYFLGGLAGFALYFVSYNFFPALTNTQSIIYGASASIMAIFIALATLRPNLEVRLILIGTVKLKYIAIVFVALDILLLDSGNTGGRMAHLGGALFGYLFATSLAKGNDWSKGFFAVVNFVGAIFYSPKKPKMRVEKGYSRKRSGSSRKKAAPKQKTSEEEHRDKIDAILDKISKSGYDSLTKAEKDYLFNESKR